MEQCTNEFEQVSIECALSHVVYKQQQVIDKLCGDEGALCNFDNKTVSMVSGCLNTTDCNDKVVQFFYQLLAPLRQLRQACCHPQLVKGGYLMGSGNPRG